MRLINFILLAILISLIGCASVPGPQNQSFRGNENLLLPYSPELEKARPQSPPYVAKFEKSKKTLFFVAASHVSSVEYPDLLMHPTFKTIKKLFSVEPIDAVVVEGIAPWEGEMPPNLMAHVDECESTGYNVNCGESWYTIQLARGKHATIFSGEPTEDEIRRKLRSSGYKDEDLLGFYIVRFIPAWKREGVFQKNQLPEMIDRQLIQIRKSLGLTIDFKFSDFKSWYKAQMQSPRDFRKIEVNDTGPVSTKDATFIQKISSVVGQARDTSVVNRVTSILNKYNKVLVVYGASHFLVQRPVFQNLLDSPQILKLF